MILLGVAIPGATYKAAADTYKFHQDHILGTSFKMIVVSDNSDGAEKAWKAALAKIAELDSALSTWRDDSEISQLNRERDTTVSNDLFEVLSLCEKYRVATKNAMSCRIGKLIEDWKKAQKSGEKPDLSMLAKLSSDIEKAPLDLDSKRQYIQRPENIVFTVNTLAKGWILDRAAETALAIGMGMKGVVLNIGGDIKVAGNVTEHIPRIGIAGPYAGDNEKPMETILLSQGGVASSGGGMRDIEIAGRTYSHILSPITGQPQSLVSVVTVVAPTAVQADALATAFAVMGIGKSLGYANSHEGVEAVIVTTGGARFTSKGWSALTAPVVKQSPAKTGSKNTWPAGYQLDIEYEIPSIGVTNYEAPYVAVWVTGQNKKLVRSLLLLGDTPRWFEENYRFWRRYGRKHPALVDTLAQPTKKPGRYRLVWDGYDDDGAPVPQGSYTLNIEASREHGGHSYMRHDLKLSDIPQEEILPSKAEIGEITLHYGLNEE